jgi:hypothetical protein
MNNKNNSKSVGKIEPSPHSDVDKWIAQLMECKPLSEQEVKALCDKVSGNSLSSTLEVQQRCIDLRPDCNLFFAYIHNYLLSEG